MRHYKYVQVISILLNSIVEHDTGDCSDVKIISRDSWGARRPKSTSTIFTPVPDFFIHPTDGGYCTSFSTCILKMKGIQNYHMDSRSELFNKNYKTKN